METASLIIGITGGVMAIVFGLVALFRNKKQDDTLDGRKDGTVLTELGYIKSGVDDIKRQQEKQEERHLKMLERIVSVESSAKQAHKRLDTLENHIFDDKN